MAKHIENRCIQGDSITTSIFFKSHKFQSRHLFLLLPFDCYYRNPTESFLSWIRVPVANRTTQAIMKLISQPTLSPSRIKIICSVSLHDPTLSVGVCRNQQTASWIQPPNTSFCCHSIMLGSRRFKGVTENAISVFYWLLCG